MNQFEEDIKKAKLDRVNAILNNFKETSKEENKDKNGKQFT